MRALLVALMLTIGSQAGAENILYCSTAHNLATGIVNDDGQWRTGRFREERFSVNEIEDFSSVQIKGTVVNELEEFSCNRPWIYSNPEGVLCQGSVGSSFF